MSRTVNKRVAQVLKSMKRSQHPYRTGTSHDFDWPSLRSTSNLGYIINRHSGMRLTNGIFNPLLEDAFNVTEEEVFLSAWQSAHGDE